MLPSEIQRHLFDAAAASSSNSLSPSSAGSSSSLGAADLLFSSSGSPSLILTLEVEAIAALAFLAARFLSDPFEGFSVAVEAMVS